MGLGSPSPFRCPPGLKERESKDRPKAEFHKEAMVYSIERTSYGYKLTFGGILTAEEMKAWVEDSKKKLLAPPPKFGVVVDMREIKPLPKDAQPHMEEGQKLYKEKGMARSAVILKNAITKMQFQRIGKETGIYEWERYIDASSVPDWEKVAVSWVVDGVDPDK